MLETHRHLLLVHGPEIVQDLLVEDVLTELRSKFVVDQDDSELIESELTSRRKAEKLLKLLPEKGYEAFQAFYEVLVDKYSHLAKLLESGISESGDEPNSAGVNVYNNNNLGNEGRMTAAHEDLLVANRVAIVEDLLVDDVLIHLQSKFVFDDNDVELIRSEKTSKRQAEKLLDLLVKKGDQAFGHFLSALKDPYPYLAELLQGQDGQTRSRFPSVTGSVQDIVDSKLLEGGVPKQPEIFTPRRQERHNVRTALRSLKDRDKWVVLHGMAGCGKTILAADALRSDTLLQETFPGGVVWVQIGPVDRQKLLMKMQNLCTRLDKDKHRPVPRNLEEARERLQTLFREQHPQTLLVLDDLWSSHDARFFDIRARVLVTTRDVGIAECIEVIRCPVRVPEKLDMRQCMDILSQWTKKKETELPGDAYDIIAECNGHPLAISIIGALLKDHPSRWLYYLTQLRKHKLSKLKSKFAYQYPNLGDAIAMSIENLDQDLRNKFEDCVIFDSSIKVPLKVFCLLWDLEDEIEVEDTLLRLVDKSLMTKEKTKCADSAREQVHYAIHNLQLDYMLETCEDIAARHKKLVKCYKKAGDRGDFSSLKDDGYVYWNLIHHMLKADQQGMAIRLLTNLAWVTKKLEVCGPADIIDDYLKVGKLVEEEEKDEFKNLNDFCQFVRANAYMFTSRPIPDVVQTALSEPANNDVYKQAKAEALKRSKKNKLYVDWCNKQSESAQSLEMTVKPHHGTIHCCVFSSDGKNILSSSSDGTTKIWEALTGKILHRFKERDVVIICAFNCDNTKVLTTSYKTVKIWKLGIQNEPKLVYSDHKQDIHCAAFSPTGKEVISCSADATIRVWDCETGQTSVVCKGHSGVVRWCCFSSDGKKIASGSDDQTVKIWDATTGECLVTTEKHDQFVSYCRFSRDDDLVYASSGTSIQIWNSVSGESRGAIDVAVQVLAFALSPVEEKIAVALPDATVQLWDIVTKEQQIEYNGHKSWVYTVDFSPDGTQLVSGSADETIKIWPVDITAFTTRVRLKKVFDVFFKEVQPIIAVADSQNRVKIFEGFSGTEVCQSEPYDSMITCVLFSFDGNTVAVSLASGKIKVLAVKTCQPVLSLVGHGDKVYSLKYNSSGSVLLSCSEDKTFMTWDSQSGKALLGSDQRHDDAVTVASFFYSDQRIVTASKDGTAKSERGDVYFADQMIDSFATSSIMNNFLPVWDSESGNLMFTCEHQRNEWVLTCVVSPDNKKIITGSPYKTVKAWDALTGQELFSISPHLDATRSLSISEDNLMFASGCDNGTIEISSLVDGKALSSCTPHTGAWVTDIVFAKNSKQLVTVGNNVQWHGTDGKLLQTFFIKGSHLRRIKSSPDFTTFITVDNIGVLYILKVFT